jgi:hypothetical protein
MVLQEGVTTDPKKLKDMKEWSTLRNEHEIRSFWAMYLLKVVYLRFRQHCEATDQTHRGETSISVVPRRRGCHPFIEGGPLYCTYPCLPAAREKFVIDM